MVAIRNKFDSVDSWESWEWLNGDGWKKFIQRVGKDLNSKFTSIPRKYRGDIWRDLHEDAKRYWSEMT